MLNYEGKSDRETSYKEISLCKYVVEGLKVASHVENVFYEMTPSFFADMQNRYF